MKKSLFTLLLCVLLFPSSVFGIEQERSREELCVAADAVVVAELTSSETVWVSGEEGGLLTRVWFAALLSLRGTPTDSTIELLLPGGEKGGLTHYVEDTPEKLDLDRRYLLFLKANPRGPGFRVLGGEAGVVALKGQRHPDGERYIEALSSVALCRQSP